MWGLIGDALAQTQQDTPTLFPTPLGEGDKTQALLWGGGILVIGGAIEIYTLLNNRLRAANSRDWPRAEGEIISARLRRPMLSGFGRYVPQIRFRYNANGQDWEHDHVMFGGHTPVNRAEADKVIARYPIGARVSVIHDPTDPRICALEHKGAEMHSLAYGAAMFVLGVGMLVAILL